MESNYKDLKINGDTQKALELKRDSAEYLHRCYNWCFKDRYNTITNNARFKKCEKQLLELN